jgi:hypothetical protein
MFGTLFRISQQSNTQITVRQRTIPKLTYSATMERRAPPRPDGCWLVNRKHTLRNQNGLGSLRAGAVSSQFSREETQTAYTGTDLNLEDTPSEQLAPSRLREWEAFVLYQRFFRSYSLQSCSRTESPSKMCMLPRVVTFIVV